MFITCSNNNNLSWKIIRQELKKEKKYEIY